MEHANKYIKERKKKPVRCVTDWIQVEMLLPDYKGDVLLSDHKRDVLLSDYK